MPMPGALDGIQVWGWGNYDSAPMENQMKKEVETVTLPGLEPHFWRLRMQSEKCWVYRQRFQRFRASGSTSKGRGQLQTLNPKP